MGQLMSLIEKPLPVGGLVSHGGAQGNAMLALAALCAQRNAPFTYHVKPMPAWLRKSPTGNLASALGYGMQLVEHVNTGAYEDAVMRASMSQQPALFVPQGAAWPDAERGVAELAHEIGEWQATRTTPLDIILPAGTGTTACFLARHLPCGPHAVRVHAVPCVGSPTYLRSQMDWLDRAAGAQGKLPHVLPPHVPVPFGSLDRRLLRSWRCAADSGELVDLVYGAVAWGTMIAHEREWPTDSSLLYINCGGQEGLPSQLRRYQRKGLLAAGETAASALEQAARLAWQGGPV